MDMKHELAFLIKGSANNKAACPLLTSSPAPNPQATQGSMGQAGKSLNVPHIFLPSSPFGHTQHSDKNKQSQTSGLAL